MDQPGKVANPARGQLNRGNEYVHYIVSGVLLMFFWCPCMAIIVSVQFNDGLLPDIILLTQYYFHRGTRLNVVKRFCISVLTFFPH